MHASKIFETEEEKNAISNINLHDEHDLLPRYEHEVNTIKQRKQKVIEILASKKEKYEALLERIADQDFCMICYESFENKDDFIHESIENIEKEYMENIEKEYVEHVKKNMIKITICYFN